MMVIFLIFYLLSFVNCDVPRLPDHIEPLTYDLKLEVYLPGYSIEPQFFGTVSIELNIKQNVNYITLHANKNIIFSRTLLEFSNPDSNSHYGISPIEITDSDEFQQVKLHFDKAIPAGRALLTILYSSKFNNDLMGFYNFTYKNEAGDLKYGALTQFEPYSARSAIPCFDEPELKATWRVSIYHPKGTNALSNTPGIRTTLYGAGSERWENFTYTTFEETPKMSSYLLAFAISEYEYESAESNSGILVNVHAPFEHRDKIPFALNAAVKAFNYFENITRNKFPIEKVDLIGFDSFGAGAMENWGLITFRSSELYGDEARVTQVIAHEIAHQWFGNLVTTQWWNEIWLNEGFASLYEYLATDYISDGKYSFKKLIEFSTNNCLDSHSQGRDTKASTKQIDKLPSIKDAFDIASYAKSGLILNMFRNIVETKSFDESIRQYLRGQSYSTSNSRILFSYFQMPRGNGPSSVDDFLRPWFEQVGHPLITVDHFNETHNVLSQSRFDNGNLAELDARLPYPSWEYQWDIPVWYLNEKNGMKIVWLLQNSTTYVSKNAKLNPEGSGIYKIKNNVKAEKLQEFGQRTIFPEII